MTATLEICGQEINGLSPEVSRLKEEVNASEGLVNPVIPEFEKLASKWVVTFDRLMQRLDSTKFATNGRAREAIAYASSLEEAGKDLLRLCEKGDGTIRNLYPLEHARIRVGVKALDLVTKAIH